ncbi:MAG TPA: hypothetical protein VKK79_14825 [Candidatus Lokiarchaeia archaeon]|nr:hypothetical protein [Candidatus Lokiarchaeia archaeon]
MGDEAPESYGLIILSQPAYLTIAKHALTHAGPRIAPDKWREVYGLLAGRLTVGNCIVTEAIPFTEGDRESVRFSAGDYAKAAMMTENLADRNPPEFLAGWYHSHFIGHEFSGVDVENHLGWQVPNKYAFGLVFDPQELSESNPGIVILKLRDVNLGEASPVDKLNFVIQQVKGKYYTWLQEYLPGGIWG